MKSIAKLFFSKRKQTKIEATNWQQLLALHFPN